VCEYCRVPHEWNADDWFADRLPGIIGPNSTFVDQSGTFPKRFSDFSKPDTEDLLRRTSEIVAEGLIHDCHVPATEENTLMWKLLGGLGSHDLSVMREALGMPLHVIGASIGFPFWSVLFQYPGFAVTYESGIDNIPRFDAHLEIYSIDKSIRVQYDTPYVKGLPVTMHICEGKGGSYSETTIRKTYEDPYTTEFKRLYELVRDDKAVKTTAEDAKRDLDIFSMIMQAGNRTGANQRPVK
jgi:predicted dehydrogenase